MRLEETVLYVCYYRVILSYGKTGAVLAFRRPDIPADVKRAIRNHRQGLRRLMLQGDWRLCPAKDAHRHATKWAGRGKVICEVCRRIDGQMFLWTLAG